ncbi:MAG: sel1 repeat family protein [Enhydrobacter sp.]|nr:MAG: sel1 repeat family protein [Enhydrobacter sp.]
MILLLLLVLAAPALAGPVEDGKAAYDRGDDASALEIWGAAADKGDADAQFWMGVLCDLGRGMAQDHAAAAQWYRRAADQGHVVAQHNLAHMYEAGHGLPAEYALAAAVTWYTRAANQGYRPSQANLGAMYATGRGVRRDDVQAYKWFVLADSAANRDHVMARMSRAAIAQGDGLVAAWKAKPER